ncbi:MAG: T9SS type A sorting domain-containing protein [Bacteroidales bacterium]|nr:T9SS type A sorting domain-containing protein [Bacteroidales bacterium]
MTFYGAFARGNPGPVRLSTLLVNEATVTLPAAAGPISGSTTVCKNNSSTYTVGTIANATTYNWTVPTGATITAGQGTTSITVNFGASAVSGNISVYGSNSGGNGAPSNLAVTVNSTPAQPSAVAGVATPCQGTSQSYTVTNVSGVVYTWSVPAGTSITAGQGTNSITVTIGGTNGAVSVVPSNSCGDGSSSSLNISVGAAPGQAATPAGPDLVDLALATTSEYTTSGAAGATNYQWSLTPAEAGSISGTGVTATVSWNGAFLGNAEVSVKAANDCGEGSFSLVKQTQVINTTGIAEGSTAINTSVYPNPSNGKFSVLPGWDKDNVQLMILDASGREMYRKNIDGRNVTNLELPLRPGIYILMLTDGIKASKTKLFIQ